MIAEVDVFGVFIDAALASAIVALLVHVLVRRLLMSAGAFAWVWHRNLADVALYLILWGAVSGAFSILGAPAPTGN